MEEIEKRKSKEEMKREAKMNDREYQDTVKRLKK
jgi:hypothetical protein